MFDSQEELNKFKLIYLSWSMILGNAIHLTPIELMSENCEMNREHGFECLNILWWVDGLYIFILSSHSIELYRKASVSLLGVDFTFPLKNNNNNQHHRHTVTDLQSTPWWRLLVTFTFLWIFYEKYLTIE